MSDGVRCMWMRGGTSKGGYFLAGDLPADPAARDRMLCAIMGSPDARQIDGLGGGDPLTSKVAVLRRSARPGVDVDYLFLQVFVDRAEVTDAQGCGNILAGVGACAIERGLVAARDGVTPVAIHMENTGKVARAEIMTPSGRVTYAGDARIDGVPGAHAPVRLSFEEIAGSTCGALLPTGRAVDMVEGVAATLIDNGMPCVILRAADLGVTGYEDRATLDADAGLKRRVEAIRLAAGPLMGLGEVGQQSVPKMTLVAPPRAGGAICTRSFIPHRCHATIGVFAAIGVATACTLPGSPAAQVAVLPPGEDMVFGVEHPGGITEALIKTRDGTILRAGMLRTARKLFDGLVFP